MIDNLSLFISLLRKYFINILLKRIMIQLGITEKINLWKEI